MAVPANTVQTFDRVANREDLTDDVFNITPTRTPVTSALGRKKASAVNHEWQSDILKAATGDNKAVQGDETAYETQPPTSRLGNYTQIMKKQVIVSGTQDAVSTAGYAKEYSYQAGKRAKELRNDMEMRVTGNYAKVAPTSSVAGEMAGLEAWMVNSDRGTGGADPTGADSNGFTGGATTATDGTQRAFAESQLKSVMQQCAELGGEPSLVTVGTINKQVFSTFAGIAPLRRNIGDSTERASILGAADMYQSDFGVLNVKYNVYQRSRTALVIDPDHAKLAFLRPIKSEARAKTGDSNRGEMIAEFTLENCNPHAHGVVADLTVS